MHRIDTEGSVGGEFSEGTPPTVPATVVGADWLNDVQGNVVQVIEDTGASLIKGLYSQLKTAVVWYVDAGIAALKAAVNTWTAQNAFEEGGIFSRTTANSDAIQATGNGVGYGVDAIGGSAGGAGVRGIGGGSAGPGVIGVCLGTAEATIGDASNGAGYGLLAVGNATRASIRSSPLSAQPTIKETGASYCDTSGRWFAATSDAWFPIGSRTSTPQTNVVGNSATVETDLHASEIPANRLLATPIVRVNAAGEVIGPGATKTLRLYVGGVNVVTWAMAPTAVTHYHLIAIIVRTGTNQQRAIIRATLINPSAESQVAAYSAIVNLSATETAAIEIKTTGQDGATPNQIQEYYFATEYP